MSVVVECSRRAVVVGVALVSVIGDVCWAPGICVAVEPVEKPSWRPQCGRDAIDSVGIPIVVRIIAASCGTAIRFAASGKSVGGSGQMAEVRPECC